MKEYLELMNDVYTNGHTHPDRTGVGRRSIFGRTLRFNLQEGFPLVTTRQIFTKALIIETLWFLSGSNRTTELEDQGVNIWKRWTPTENDAFAFIEKYQQKMRDQFTTMTSNPGNDPNQTKIWIEDQLDVWKSRVMDRVGTIGPMYGAVWRGNYPGSNGRDQITTLIRDLLTDPFSARMIVTAWLPNLQPDTKMTPIENVLMGNPALSACHKSFQCFVKPDKDGGKNKLNMLVEIRSSDVPIGLPYNIAQYALLCSMIAQVTNMVPGELIVNTGDTHIYADQLPFVPTQLSRNPFDKPKLILNPAIENLTDFKPEDIEIKGYAIEGQDFWPKINYPVAT